MILKFTETEKPFKPVTIELTLESAHEVAAMLAMARMNNTIPNAVGKDYYDTVFNFLEQLRFLL